MTKDQLIDELIRAKAGELRAKRVRSERGWCKQGIHLFKDQEYEVILTLAATFPIKRICRVLGINRSGFYKWKYRLEHPSQKLLDFADNLQLFKEYHVKYPSHGYRWLNAKFVSIPVRLCPISMHINVAKRSAS